MSPREPLFDAEGLARMLATHGLDAVIARSGRNVAWLSGMRFPGTLGRLQDFSHAPRAAIVVWPRTGEPALFASHIATGLARRLAWIADIRGYTEYRDSPVALAARDLRRRGLDTGRIGIERRELNVEQWDTLRAELPRAELIDCTDALESARNIKTPAEVALLRQAAALQDEAHLEVFAAARPGDTERVLHARMVAAMLRIGAESAHGMLQASTNPVTYGGEGDTPFERGVALRTDYVCYLDGYAANLSRMAVMGPANAQQEYLYATLLRVRRAVVDEALRAGVEARDVYRIFRARMEEAGHPRVAGLVGHSIGVWWHQEEPMLAPSEPRPLRAGMVVCLEPILDGFWHIQDEYLITDGDAELLSTRLDTSLLYEMGT